MRVIYDGRCGICRRFKAAVDRVDRRDRLAWTPLQDVDYDAVPVTEQECVNAMQVVDGDAVFAGFYAVRRICRALPVLWPIYLLLSVPGVPIAGERVYRAVARHRHCMVDV